MTSCGCVSLEQSQALSRDLSAPRTEESSCSHLETILKIITLRCKMFVEAWTHFMLFSVFLENVSASAVKNVAQDQEDIKSHPQFSYHSVCEFNGSNYSVGEFRISKCVTCTCDSTTGSVHCRVESCAPFKNCILLKLEADDCCPSCVERGCEFEGNLYTVGTSFRHQPCTECECRADHTGDVSMECQEEICSTPQCTEPVRIPSVCCPICPSGKQRTDNSCNNMGLFRRAA